MSESQLSKSQGVCCGPCQIKCEDQIMPYIFKDDLGQRRFAYARFNRASGLAWTPGKREKKSGLCPGTYPHHWQGTSHEDCKACASALNPVARAVATFKRWIERTFGDR